MQAPEFWQRDGLAGCLLEPLGQAYGLLGQLRSRVARQSAAALPVICVGNLTVGGAGKTPTVIALAAHLAGQGHRPHLLTRGYGGAARGPLRVDPERQTAREVGDEALLLARAAPTWLARDRVQGATMAAAAEADLVIMDDGLQNPYLRQDLRLVVVDGAVGFGNRRLLPAGPLREPVTAGLRRASALIRIGADRAGIASLLPPDLPCLGAEIATLAEAKALAGQRIVAFAGIGRPAKFFASLKALGAELVAAHAFADHHPYRPGEIAGLLAEAEERRAICCTTAKDHVRLDPEDRKRIRCLPVVLTFDDPGALDRLLAPLLARLRA
jgi:tetraacyldisaccharide 4'-kinase